MCQFKVDFFPLCLKKGIKSLHMAFSNCLRESLLNSQNVLWTTVHYQSVN